MLAMLCFLFVFTGPSAALQLKSTSSTNMTSPVHKAPGEEGAEWWEWCDCGEQPSGVKITLEFKLKAFFRSGKTISPTMEAWVDAGSSYTFNLTHLPKPSRHSQPRQYQHTNGGMIQVVWTIGQCGGSISDAFFLQSSRMTVSVRDEFKNGVLGTCKKTSGRIRMQTR